MRKTAILILAFCFVLLAEEDSQPQVGDQIAIAVQNQSIYPMPAFYASPTQPVTYGTLATIDEIQGEWYRITTSGDETGWIHKTAVTGAIQTSSSGTTASGEVTNDELMLAGRGFNEDIEESYAGKNPDLDYAMVDEVEASWEVTPDQLYQFLVQGNLIEASSEAQNTGTQDQQQDDTQQQNDQGGVRG